VVWLGQNESGDTAAIKVLHRCGTEPLARFRDEIHFLRSLAGRPGVIPLLDAYSPDFLSADDHPWHATPAGDPLDKVSNELSFTETVEVIANIARVLEALHEDGSYHRDIKPSNILRIEGGWFLGDFGLAAFSGRAGVTAPGDKLGPLFYIAPEMLNLRTDSFGPADVFSLAKTLWVLATGQKYPLPGELLIEYPGARISSYEPSPRAALLERLLYQCTRTDPSLRPSMGQFRAELDRWMSDVTGAANQDEPDLSDLRARLEAVTEASVRQAEHDENLGAEFESLVSHVDRLLEAVNRALIRAVPFEVGKGRHGLGPGLATEPSARVLRTAGIHVRFGSPRPSRTKLQADVTLRLTEDEQVEVGAAWVLRGGSEIVVWRSDPARLLLGSVSTGQILSTLVGQLHDQLPSAVRKFTETVEAARS